MTYYVAPTPNPPDASNIRLYRELRLTALRTDPSCFSSTYQREVAFPEETWRDRLTGSNKATFIAHARAEKAAGGEAGDFAGSVTVVAAWNVPAALVPRGADPSRTYLIFGMWVRPEDRRRGLGRMLIEGGMKWAAEDAKTIEVRAGGPSFEAWLSVNATNEEARRLYETAGFQKANEEGESGRDEGGESEKWMRRKLELGV